MEIKLIMEKMNSDIFEGVEKEVYNVDGFTRLEIEQAKQLFYHNGYKVFERNTDVQGIKLNILNVKK